MAGIGESTLRGYMQNTEFVERYEMAFSDMVRDAAPQAGQICTVAALISGVVQRAQ